MQAAFCCGLFLGASIAFFATLLFADYFKF